MVCALDCYRTGQKKKLARMLHGMQDHFSKYDQNHQASWFSLTNLLKTIAFVSKKMNFYLTGAAPSSKSRHFLY